jgi:hypothetical protein
MGKLSLLRLGVQISRNHEPSRSLPQKSPRPHRQARAEGAGMSFFAYADITIATLAVIGIVVLIVVLIVWFNRDP